MCLSYCVALHYNISYRFIKRPGERERQMEREKSDYTASTHTHTRRKSIGQIFLRRYVYYGAHICCPRGPYYDKYQIEWRERCLFPYNFLPTPVHQDISIEQRNTCTVAYGARKKPLVASVSNIYGKSIIAAVTTIVAVRVCVRLPFPRVMGESAFDVPYINLRVNWSPPTIGKKNTALGFINAII